MPALVRPTETVRDSFLAGVEEFRAEGRGGAGDNSMLGRDILRWAPRWQEAAVFAAYVEETLADAHEDSGRPAGFVPSTVLWWVDGTEWLGRLSIRHRLTPRLLEWGGLIGYDVRPSVRRRGHGTAMLRAALPRARALGLDEVLLTCDFDNVGSRKVIEAAGGVFEDRRAEKLRYWISTGAHAGGA
ncbi:GNAT family N-acetyltransferase [Streptomyces sp. XM4011]|uniref:GNAT family N-acetyltransferase n=1 Tax=Streptomyces TaxID=1883 RepID=UPI00031771E3|nr:MULTISPECIES: GNAT family N-acetyltransferase [Streptomyces]MCK1813176.1 GNAT family N-acetyltransferase [Streptomyces sp. XM4011]